MKVVKIQNEFKIISTLKPEEIQKLAKAGKNVLYEDKKPVFGIAVGATPSFTAKDATFNQTSDKGYAMITVSCDAEYGKKFENDAEAIKDFTEENLAALNNLKAAEVEFSAILASLNSNIDAIVKDIKTVSID